jgi:hypothetical protein
MARQFSSGSAFKASLEAHLRKRAEERGAPFSTLQLKFVIERLLARLFREGNPSWLLKGGFAMDFRFRPRARTTQDVDLSVALATGSGAEALATLREKLQAAADADLGDYLTYRIGMPKQELTNAPKGGGRYPCEALLVGKTYAKFHIDVGIGDALVGEPDSLTGDDLLGFAAIEPATVLAIPKPQQFAEKIHAYTFPWSERLNTRTKDLVDLVLLLEHGLPDAEEIRGALAATFSTRATHPIPEQLSPPPEFWAADFSRMADEAKLSTRDYLVAFAELSRFWSENKLGVKPPLQEVNKSP